MQVVLESPSALERQFTITIPNGDVETEFEAKLAETAKRVRVDGFRPGKVPASVVRQRYGQAIRQEIVSDLMEKSLGQALSEHDVKPIGQPKSMMYSLRKAPIFHSRRLLKSFLSLIHI